MKLATYIYMAGETKIAKIPVACKEEWMIHTHDGVNYSKGFLWLERKVFGL